MKTHFLSPSLRWVTALAFTAHFALIGCSSTRQDVASTEYPTSKSYGNGSSQGTDGGQMTLPPGWTEADMQACMAAGTPGEMHQKLARSVGRWSGTSSMWMAPDTQPIQSACTSTVTALMDGRYVKTEFGGDMPGMGPFQGLGFSGYDNVSQKFVSTWIDNHSTGIMTGEGTMSNDGNTLTWNYRYNCPITKKQTTMREIYRFTSDNSMTLEMHGTDPKSGKEFKMMYIELTRQSS